MIHARFCHRARGVSTPLCENYFSGSPQRVGKVALSNSCVEAVRGFTQFGQQGGQLQKRLDGERVRRLRWLDGCIWKAPVRPLLRDRVAASIRMSENEGVDARYAPGLEYFKALTTQRVERMGDRRPSQTRIVGVCS